MINKTKTNFFIIFYAFLIMSITSVYAEKPIYRVSIHKSSNKRPTILIVFDGSDKMKNSVESAIYEYVKRSGLVNIISRGEKASNLMKKEGFYNFKGSSWRSSGAEFVVKVKEQKKLGVPKWESVVCSVAKSKTLDKFSKAVSSKQEGRIVTQLGDFILKTITGKAGLGSHRIAFVSDKRGTKTIYSCDVLGKGMNQIVHNKAMILSPHWGVGQKSILYTSYQNINPRLFLKDLVSNRVETISKFPGLNVNGKLNSRGEVVFTASKDGNPEIYRYSPGSRKYKRLTKSSTVEANPSWSPDGQQIAFVSNMSGKPQVFVMDRDGRRVNRLTYSGSYNTAPVWSPNSKLLAFSTRVRGKMQLAIYDFVSKRMEIIVDKMKNAEAPAWGPTSKHIAFSSDKKGNWDIYIVDIEMREIYRVTKGFGNCTNPAWA